MIELRPDGRAEWILILSGLAGACGLALQAVDLPAAARLALLGAVLARIGLEGARRLWPQHPAYVARARLLPDGRWQLETGPGRVLDARLLQGWGASHGPVMALEWACDDGRRRQAWLWRRHCPAAGWRRLRVRLRLA